jgi:predicted ester cyclase
MSTEENKAIAIRHIKDVLEGGHVELIDSYYAPDGSEPGMESPEKWKDTVLWFHKTCPGFKITILDMMADGEKVMVNSHLELTYSVPTDPPPSFFPPFGKPVSWRSMDVFRIVDGKLVSQQSVGGWMDMLVENGVIPLEKIEQNRSAVRKFVDALNRQDTVLLAEICTPEVAKEWTEALSWIYTTMKDHHIDVIDMVADGEMAAVSMATRGFHTGELFGLPPTGKEWTNQGIGMFYFNLGKISKVDSHFDAENHIKQLGGVIQPSAV